MAGMLRRRVATLAALVVLAGTPTLARAGDRTQAEALLDEGRRLMGESRWAEACPKLAASQKLEPGAATLLLLGDCSERRKLHASAWTYYREAAALARGRGDAERERSAKERADQVEPRLSKIQVLASTALPPGAEIRRDNVVIPEGALGTPIPVDSGKHTVEAWVGGELKFRTSVQVTEDGAVTTVKLPSLDAGPADRPPFKPVSDVPEDRFGAGNQRIVAVALGGLGVAGIAVGLGFGWRARTIWNDVLTNHCDAQRRCDDYGIDEASVARKDGNIGTVAFGFGTVALLTAAVVWFTARHGAPTVEPRAGARVGAGGVRF